MKTRLQDKDDISLRTFVVPDARKPGNWLRSGKGRDGTIRTLIQIFRLTRTEHVPCHDRDSFLVLSPLYWRNEKSCASYHEIYADAKLYENVMAFEVVYYII